MFTKSIFLTALNLAIALGSFAQNDTSMLSINNNAPVKFTKVISINAPKETIWNVLTDINNWYKWQKDISSSELNGKLKPNTTFDWKSGGVKIHSTLHTVDSSNMIGWTGKAIGVYAIHNWTITEVNGVTQVKVEESMEGFLVKLFRKSFQKKLEEGLTTWLDLLKKECEGN